MKKLNINLGYAEGLISVVINTALFGLKFWAGVAIGSVAMIADAWHTLSDTLTSLVVLVGFWVAGRPKDQGHPFGHGRAELVAAIIIGTLLAVVGLNFGKESIDQLRNHQAVRFTAWGIGIFAVSILFKEGLAQFSFWAGRKIHSQALLGDGWHHRSDAVASLLIVIGALFGDHFWWMDGVLGLGVSSLIVYAAYDVLKGAVNPILGEAPGQQLEADIRQTLADAAPEVSQAHHLHMHRYGDHLEVTLHLKVPGNYSVEQAHDVASRIENELREKLKIEPTIHVEPEHK